MEDGAYLCYRELSKVTFPKVPETEWAPYYRDLVALEPSLVFGDLIEYVSDYSFVFQVTNPWPLCKKPIIYPKAERE